MAPLSRAMQALLLTSCLVSPVLSRPVQAAEVSDAQARALEGQIKTWLAGYLWVGAALPGRPVELTPAGDHYAARIPLGTAGGGTGTVDLTADVTPLDGDRWGLRNFRFPSPSTFSFDMPTGETRDGKPSTTRATYTMKVAEQEAGGTFDPTYATATEFRSAYRALTLQAEIDGKTSVSQVASASGTSTLTPAGDGRANQTVTSSFEGYTSSATLPDGTPITVAFDKVGVNGQVTNVSRDKAAEISRSLFTLIGALQKAKTPDGPPDPSQLDRTPLRALVAAVRGFADSGKITETFEGIRVKVGDVGGGLDKAVIGFSVASVNGLALAGMDLGLEGLKVSDLPLGPYEPFIPRRLALSPTVTGISTTDLMDLAQAALDDDGAKLNGMMGTIFGHGGIVVGLENLALDVAGSSFTGQGKVTVPDPTQASGTGKLVATNFDGLVNQLKALPEAQQVIPALMLAKGFGQASGDTITWNVSYDGGRLLVNGTDLTAMMGGAPAAPPPQRSAPAAPNRAPSGPPKR